MANPDGPGADGSGAGHPRHKIMAAGQILDGDDEVLVYPHRQRSCRRMARGTERHQRFHRSPNGPAGA